jgi:hypothetical protein
VDQGGADKRARRHLASARRAGARAHRCSPSVVEEDEPNEAVPEGFSPEHERWRRGGATEVKNGTCMSLARGRGKARRILGERGKRGDEVWGFSSLFIGAEGASGRGG